MKSILEAHAYKRSVQEIAFLRAAFKNITYFNDLLELVDEKLQDIILREVRVVKVPKGKAVFEAGDHSISTSFGYKFLLKNGY
mgnify:CR=1 FL=1